jgi:hypothetical protein
LYVVLASRPYVYGMFPAATTISPSYEASMKTVAATGAVSHSTEMVATRDAPVAASAAVVAPVRRQSSCAVTLTAASIATKLASDTNDSGWGTWRRVGGWRGPGEQGGAGA